MEVRGVLTWLTPALVVGMAEWLVYVVLTPALAVGMAERLGYARLRVWAWWRCGVCDLLDSLSGAELQLGDAGIERSYLVMQLVLEILT